MYVEITEIISDKVFLIKNAFSTELIDKSINRIKYNIEIKRFIARLK